MKHFRHLASQRHIDVAAFFMVKPLGTNNPILTYFSTLEPLDRCVILELLFEMGQHNINVYDKMVLAYVKVG